jgi:Domain of unknown function (DUF6894)
MPRYYIDVRSSLSLNEDMDGIEVADVSAAHAEALAVGRKLRERWTEIPFEARDDIFVEVVDESLRTVLKVPLSEIGSQTLI